MQYVVLSYYSQFWMVLLSFLHYVINVNCPCKKRIYQNLSFFIWDLSTNNEMVIFFYFFTFCNKYINYICKIL